jgi:hypothetical protein
MNTLIVNYAVSKDLRGHKKGRFQLNVIKEEHPKGNFLTFAPSNKIGK